MQRVSFESRLRAMPNIGMVLADLAREALSKMKRGKQSASTEQKTLAFEKAQFLGGVALENSQPPLIRQTQSKSRRVRRHAK